MNLWLELKRRNVFRVAVFYGVSAWLLLQVGDVLAGLFGLPDYTLRMVGFLLLLGFPLVVILSWVYEMTPEGVKREKDIDRNTQRITGETGRKLDIVTIVIAAMAIGVVGWQQLTGRAPPAPSSATPTDVANPASKEASPVSEPADQRSAIAVLPFSNLSGNAEALPFTQGLHDDLLTRLSRISNLKVVSRTSVLEYAGTTKNIRTIGQELGVSHLLEGGVQRAGDRVRINVQLIDAATDEHLWADTYDRELTVQNIFDLQSAIADRITQALEVSLTAPAATLTQKSTDNLAAYEAYLRGRLELETGDYSLDTSTRAIEQFRRAVELDPQFANAWAGLSHAMDSQFWFGGRKREDREAVREYAQRSLSIDPDLPNGHLAMGNYYYHGLLDYERALESLGRAEEALQGDSQYWSTKAAVYRRMGDNDRAVPLFEKAVSLNPRGAADYLDLFISYRMQLRFSDALNIVDGMQSLSVDSRTVAFRRAMILRSWTGDNTAMIEFIDQSGVGPYDGLWMSLPDALESLRFVAGGTAVDAFLDQLVTGGHVMSDEVAWAYVVLGSKTADQVRSALESRLKEMSDRMAAEGTATPVLPLVVAGHLLLLGMESEGRQMLEASLQEPWVTRDRMFGAGYYARAAQQFVQLGDTDRALDLLELALEINPSSNCLRTYIQHPWLAPLENHPRFPEVLARFGWEWEDRSQGL